MSRMKKKRPAASGKQLTIPCMPGQRAAKDGQKQSTRPHDYLRRWSGKVPEKAQEASVAGSCAALPALIIAPCGTPSASSPPAPNLNKYHKSCYPTPIPHSPRTGHTPQRDFDSYALRYLAEKAISHSKKYAEERSSERCRRYRCSPPPLKTRHKHYCGQRPYRRDRTMVQMVSNAVEKGFDAFRSLLEDGPIGNSARCCRRRIKRLLRPIWCNCLRHTCLGAPADPIQRYVLTRGRTAPDFARNREHMNKFPRPPTPMACSPQLSSPKPEVVLKL